MSSPIYKPVVLQDGYGNKPILVIFAQAPADIQYVVSLYKNYRANYRLLIYVMALEPIYRFLCSRGLSDARIQFIPIPKPSQRLRRLWIVRWQLTVLVRQLQREDRGEILFFSYYFDYYTFYMVAHLAKHHHVSLIDIYRHVRLPLAHLRLIDRAKLLLLQTFFNVRLRYTESEAGPVVTFRFPEYGIETAQIHVAQETLDPYLYRIPGIDFRSLLFFESGPPPGADPVHYANVVVRVVKRLKYLGWRVYIKPHPRTAYSGELDLTYVKIVPAYIPAELIEARRFAFVLGVYSASIANLAHNQGVPAVSIGPMIKFQNPAAQLELHKYLQVLAEGGPLHFVRNMRELESFLQDNNIIPHSKNMQNQI